MQWKKHFGRVLFTTHVCGNGQNRYLVGGKAVHIREYMPVYSRLVKDHGLYHIYIDSFARYGLHESKTSGEIVAGSPLNALNTAPPFREYHFIELAPSRAERLQTYERGRSDVHVHEGD
jgi:three-Cys-motif partner protein